LKICVSPSLAVEIHARALESAPRRPPHHEPVLQRLTKLMAQTALCQCLALAPCRALARQVGAICALARPAPMAVLPAGMQAPVMQPLASVAVQWSLMMATHAQSTTRLGPASLETVCKSVLLEVEAPIVSAAPRASSPLVATPSCQLLTASSAQLERLHQASRPRPVPTAVYLFALPVMVGLPAPSALRVSTQLEDLPRPLTPHAPSAHLERLPL